ncbi:protease modulator HflC [Lutispora thermophila]|uniref:Protein HflC n=1 Tax=Lutispora thermophila DSM 19022 TaxID=1122184 RepID=A0A1M6HQL7_9FIRM|nr:protease modulator HflC [Lutispora thermophila]SHJ24495.1 membrane protease subunit HflC [Lutispora thermophila DSM 19022]
MNHFNNINIKKRDNKLISAIKKAALLISTIVIVLIIILNAHIVQEDEIMFVSTFGKTIKVIDKPGLYFKIPLINTTSTISKKIFCYESQPLKIITKDNRNLFIETFVLWSINDPKLFIHTLQSNVNAEIRIENTVSSYLKISSINQSFIDIINNNNELNKILSAYISDELEVYGIKVIDARFRNMYLSDENKDAVYTRIKSEKEIIASQYLNLGEKEASRIRSETDKEVNMILSKAQAEAERIKGAADAEAAQIYASSYNKDPEFYKFMRTLEAYKKTLMNKPTIVIPIDSPFAKYLMGK